MHVARRRQLNDDFVRRSFRDVADQDYVLARVGYRYELYLQLVTLGHQAIERYLKAILLFNDLPTKHIKHNIVHALADVRTRLPFAVTIPMDVDEFVARLNRQASRYFENSFGATARTLVALDRAVWHIRRYCEDMHRMHAPPTAHFQKSSDSMSTSILQSCLRDPTHSGTLPAFSKTSSPVRTDNYGVS